MFNGSISLHLCRYLLFFSVVAFRHAIDATDACWYNFWSASRTLSLGNTRMVLRRRKSVDKELLRESRHGSYSPPPSRGTELLLYDYKVPICYSFIATPIRPFPLIKSKILGSSLISLFFHIPCLFHQKPKKKKKCIQNLSLSHFFFQVDFLALCFYVQTTSKFFFFKVNGWFLKKILKLDF